MIIPIQRTSKIGDVLMKISLIALNSKYIHSNLAVYYLKASCPHHDVKIFEYTVNEDKGYLLGEIYREKADVYGFSCYIWNIEMIMSITKELKKVRPQARILLGGPEVSFDPVNIMTENPWIDFIISGEGEKPIALLMDCIKEGESKQFLSNIQGLTYHSEKGINTNPEGEPMDLEEIPDFIDDYLEGISNRLLYYETSRGCPYNCSYCLSSTFKGVKFMPMDRLIKDMEKIIHKDISLIKFVDRTFNTNKDHYMKVFSFFKDNSKNTKCHFEICGDILDEETMVFLDNINPGLFQFEVGIQSTNKDSLEAINRKMDFEKLTSNIKRITDKGNIPMHLDLIAGLPFEDYTSFAKSFNDVIKLNPDMLQLGFLKFLKGTGIRENDSIHQYKYRDYAPYEVLENKFITYEEILKLKEIEEILDKYYNSKDFSSSYSYLSNRYYKNNPFAFFEDFANHWNRQGLFKLPQSHKGLFEIIYNYVVETWQDISFVDFLKYDYLSLGKNYQMPQWLSPQTSKEYKDRNYSFLDNRENISRFLPEMLDKNTREIVKSTHIERFNYSLGNLKIGHWVDSRETTIIFLYENKKCIGTREIIL